MLQVLLFVENLTLKIILKIILLNSFYLNKKNKIFLILKINIKFYDIDNKIVTQLIEFSHTEDFEDKKFEIEPINGEKILVLYFYLDVILILNGFNLNK